MFYPPHNDDDDPSLVADRARLDTEQGEPVPCSHGPFYCADLPEGDHTECGGEEP